MELNTLRKNKISLEDYDFKQDIENRLLMGQFTSTDLEILEEILYSSIKIPVRKLAKCVGLSESEVFPILDKISKTGLFAFEDDSIVVDKEMRKYFEGQVLKFDPDFKPGMEFLQGLLRKVPIHVLPVWYSIPRTSNNIFDSLVEKYLLTPQIFHRYLMELNFPNPILSSIVQEVYSASEFKVNGKYLMAKHGISHEQFEEFLLQLEFHFACCLGYEKIDDEWQEIVTPFFEWREYATFLNSTEVPSITSANKVIRHRPHDFSYIQDLSHILSMTKKQPLTLSLDKNKRYMPPKATLTALAAKFEGFDEDSPTFLNYVDRLITKMRQLKLADIVESRLYALESANDFLDMRPDNRAHFLHRHPLNRLRFQRYPR